jgi:hypothetical protein
VTRLAISCVMIAVIFSSGSVQRSCSQDTGAADENRPAQRPAQRQPAQNRGSRSPRSIEVKDPAEFSRSQDQPIFSGPQPPERLPSFTALGITGELAGKEFDAVALADGKPQILVFQDDSGVGVRGIFQFSRLLSHIAGKSKTGLHASTIFLGDDPAALTTFTSRFAERLGENLVPGISRDGRDGPGAYGLNRNVAMTILIAKEGKVTHNFAFPQSMLYPDPYVLGAIAEVIGESRETVQQWLSELQSAEPAMRGGNATPTDGRVALRKRLGELVANGRLTTAEARELFHAAFPDNNAPRAMRER